MLTIYIIGVLLLGGYCSYRFGQLSDWRRCDAISLFFFGTLLWPLVIVFAIAIAPFFGLYMLGKRNKDK